MTEVDEEGLFIIEDGEVTHVHSSAAKTNMDALRDYLKEWDLEV